MKNNIGRAILVLAAANLVVSIFNHFKLKSIMTKQERFDKFLTDLFEVTNNIAEDYNTLITEVRSGTVSDESMAKAEANIGKLKEIGAQVDNPLSDGGDTTTTTTQAPETTTTTNAPEVTTTTTTEAPASTTTTEAPTGPGGLTDGGNKQG